LELGLFALLALSLAPALELFRVRLDPAFLLLLWEHADEGDCRLAVEPRPTGGLRLLVGVSGESREGVVNGGGCG
jgi:hypothetical protein